VTKFCCFYSGTSEKTYRNLKPGIYRAEVEATSTSNPSVKFTLNIRQIAVPNIDLNCTQCEPVDYQGTASVSVDAPNAVINLNLNKPSFVMCSLNNGPQEPCEATYAQETLKYLIFIVGHDKFRYKNLAVGAYNLVITAISTCFPYDDLVYTTDFTIGAPGRQTVYRLYE